MPQRWPNWHSPQTGVLDTQSRWVRAGHGPPSPPPISCSLGSCGRERLWGLFLVGLSPGRRDVQKSTGQAEGLAKVRVKRQAEE